MAAVSDGGRRTRGAGTLSDRAHFARILGIWAVMSAILCPIFYLLVGPHLPPGHMASAASGDSWDLNVLSTIAIPVVLFIWIYYAYAIINWRASRVEGEPLAHPAARGHLTIQTLWIGLTTAIVMGLFIFGTVELIVPAGAGGGEGPNPVWTPATKKPLVVQVIAQQWLFDYRYPSFGGFETTDLVLPANTTVAFHVTSLDVIHDFWAYELGVKANANPQTDNVAYTTTQQLGTFVVRCDELCGIWHGAMFDYGKIVPKSSFMSWARSTEAKLAKQTKLLPPFAWTYTPDANGADGGFYPDCSTGQTTGCDSYSNIENYGASAKASAKEAA